MITVVMPTWNGLRFLPEQLDSILRELPENGVLRIRDDGSTDGTTSYVRDRAADDDRIHLLPSTGRIGVIRSVERLLEGLDSGTIFLADQDDVWLPGKVASCMVALETADLVVHDARRVDAEGVDLGGTLFGTRGCGGGIFRNLWKNQFTGCCMALRAEILPKVLPFPMQVPMHDQWLGLVALRRGRVSWLREELLAYRVHRGNATGTGGQRPSASAMRRILWRFQALQALGR